MNFKTHVTRLKEKGLNIQAIAEELNAKGIVSPLGKKVTPHIVKFALYGKPKSGGQELSSAQYERVTAAPRLAASLSTAAPEKPAIAVAIIGPAAEIASIVKGLMQ